MRAQSIRSRRLVLPLVVALVGFVINAVVATTMAETTDEPLHVRYGSAVLQGTPDKSEPTFDSKMPISALNAMHRIVSRYLRTHHKSPRIVQALRDFRAARYATIFGGFGLCMLVYLYAERLYGWPAGLAAQLLFILSPNIIANSSLATTDLHFALVTTLFLYSLRRFLERPTAPNAFLSASALAFAQVTKFLALDLYLALFLILIPFARRLPRQRIALLLALNIACFLIFVNAGFLFDRAFTPLAGYSFHSRTFQKLQQMGWLSRIPLPAPYPYIQGFDWMSYHNATSLSFGNIVLLGEVRGKHLARSDGFPSYYLVAYALKEPIGMQLLLLVALVSLVRFRKGARFLVNEWPLLVTAVVLLAQLSFFSRAQIGIRHILPVLVVSVILSGAAFAGWTQFGRPRKLLLAGCLLYTALSVASYFPHMIPYFNELVPDRKMAYQYLADSNLDWGQDKWVVESFLEKHPDVILNPEHPIPGRVLVSGNLLAGVFPDRADYWVRQRGLKPVAHVGYAHFLFSVPP